MISLIGAAERNELGVDLRFGIGWRIQSNIVRSVGLHVGILGITPRLGLVLEMIDVKLPRMWRYLCCDRVPIHFLSFTAALFWRQRTYSCGICCRKSAELSPPASIRKTEYPLVARLALWLDVSMYMGLECKSERIY